MYFYTYLTYSISNLLLRRRGARFHHHHLAITPTCQPSHAPPSTRAETLNYSRSASPSIKLEMAPYGLIPPSSSASPRGFRKSLSAPISPCPKISSRENDAKKKKQKGFDLCLSGGLKEGTASLSPLLLLQPGAAVVVSRLMRQRRRRFCSRKCQTRRGGKGGGGGGGGGGGAGDSGGDACVSTLWQRDKGRFVQVYKSTETLSRSFRLWLV